MNHSDSVLKFSLGLNGLSFEIGSQHIQIEQGLGFVGSKSIGHGVIDELAIEKMIYFIEEIIESQPLRNLNINGIAVTADTAMAQLRELFFGAKKQISRIEFEHGFNDFELLHESSSSRSGLCFYLLCICSRDDASLTS